MKVKPFLKWVGGKTSIIDDILTSFPNDITEYHEFFLGGGSVLLSLLQSNKISNDTKIYCYDINKALIYCYINIQTHIKELLKALADITNQYMSIKEFKISPINTNPSQKESIFSKENMYYFIRNKYNNLSNKTTIQASAYFIFLNKTCFRGLYRVGPNGFNVPFGNYKTPTIYNEDNLLALNKLIKNVVFQHLDYVEAIKQIENKDAFFYLDPPYAPINQKSFTKYTKEAFNQQEFFNIVKTFTNKFVMSNSNVVIKDFEKNYSIKRLQVPRRINSKNPSSYEEEVIISN